MADAKAAKKEDAAPAATAGKKKKGGGTIGLILLMTVFGAAVPFIMPTLILVIVGMLPTLVALMTDNDRQKSSTIAVGAMNIAGITPFAIDLWMKGQTMVNLFQTLRDPTTWLVMLGAAGIGQLIVFAVPQAVALLAFARDESRLKLLKRNLDSLKDSWGPEVGTTKPIEQIGNGS
jgi:hypothetical protein